jgi:hypothetical protein
MACKGAFAFKQRNVFCYLCFLPLDDMGFHLDNRCKFSEIVPRDTLCYVAWTGKDSSGDEDGTLLENGDRVAQLALREPRSQCLPPYLAGDRVDACRCSRRQRPLHLIVTYKGDSTICSGIPLRSCRSARTPQGFARNPNPGRPPAGCTITFESCPSNVAT